MNSCDLDVVNYSGGHSILGMHWGKYRASRPWVRESPCFELCASREVVSLVFG